jgi:hypothetical protein
MPSLNQVSTAVSRTVLGPSQPPIQWAPGYISLEVNRPGREADQSPPYSTEAKNAWSYTSISQYAFIAWCLVKHRDNFTYMRQILEKLVLFLKVYVCRFIVVSYTAHVPRAEYHWRRHYLGSPVCLSVCLSVSPNLCPVFRLSTFCRLCLLSSVYK